MPMQKPTRVRNNVHIQMTQTHPEKNDIMIFDHSRGATTKTVTSSQNLDQLEHQTITFS